MNNVFFFKENQILMLYSRLEVEKVLPKVRYVCAMSVTLAYLVQAISKTLNPEWNQNFILTLKGLKDDLNISVFDKDTFSKVKSFFLLNESDSLS